MERYVLPLHKLDKSTISLAGGKAANLGELCKMEGVRVPAGFCVSTEAYKDVVGELPLLHELSLLTAKDRDAIRSVSAAIRNEIERIPIPQRVVDAIRPHLNEAMAYAVRSSATAEDLPTASFAGQQDSFLNVTGAAAVLHAISKCWASLFTERAITYRMQNGFEHSKVQLAVVVQQMVFAEAAGILFTADPVSGNRKIVSIDASFGLGEALVGGLVNTDLYKVREGRIIDKRIASKTLVMKAAANGGTEEQALETDHQSKPALTDEQVLQLERIGRKIEANFGQPQDIEWCLLNNEIYVVQSRPITTLYPVPLVNDNQKHLYVSVAHQQVMTDAMKPLGLSIRALTARGRPMYIAGGRMFVDIAPELSAPASRRMIVDVIGKWDLLLKDALHTILERGDFIPPLADSAVDNAPSLPDFNTIVEYDPNIVAELIAVSEAEVAALRQAIQGKTGLTLIDFIAEDLQQLHKSISNPNSFNVFMTAMNASHWINNKICEWLGEQNVADVLTQSVPNNITSEMGLALLDVADVIRPYRQVIDFLQHTNDDRFLDRLPQLNGGAAVRAAIVGFLEKHGMRCAGEIDITRPRWTEKPLTLVPALLSNIRNLEPGASKRKFEQGLKEAQQKETDILNRLKQLPDGEQKAAETKRMIQLVRGYSGYREYPKYEMVSRYLIYKQALLREAEALPVHDTEDIYYLNFEELREAVRTGTINYAIINQRKAEFISFEKLTPPRLLTSEGEVVTGKYKRDHLPEKAMAGLAVSSGTIEGRARVILKMEEADMEAGDILVTTFTDPSWTPLFVSIAGLVTEVGGLMTHGAVIAREYGLPAVVGVEHATKLIKDGQRIRVNGTEGYVEVIG